MDCKAAWGKASHIYARIVRSKETGVNVQESAHELAGENGGCLAQNFPSNLKSKDVGVGDKKE